MDSMDATSSAPHSTESTLPATVPSSSSAPSTPEIPPSSSSNANPNPNPLSNSNSNQNPSQNPQPSTSLQQLQPQHLLQQQQQQRQLLQQQPSTLQHSQIRPSPLNRPRPQPPYPHFATLPSSSSSSSSSTSFSSLPASSSISTTSVQRGLAIGVPAHSARPPQQPTSFSSFGSSSYSQPFVGLGRNSVKMPDPITNPSTTQVRQPIQGIQGVGMMGSLGSSSQVRQGGVTAPHQQRPLQPSMRLPSSSSNQSLTTQKFQGHGLVRAPSLGSSGSPSPVTPQSLQTHPQTWMSGGPQGKQMHPPSLPSPSYRPQVKPQSLQQRSHIPQQHHTQLPTASHQQLMISSQQTPQVSQSHQPQEHYGQQYPPSRVSQSMSHQQQVTRGQGSGNHKPPSLGTVQPSISLSGPHNAAAASLDAGESGGQILSKRSIHELVTQIDPSERLDPDVEDILVELADEFVDSITSFGCLLAKHRKSSTLEAKDILLHLERNWKMTLPGFGGEEIKGYKKPFTNEIHKERIAAVKKSLVGADPTSTKSSAGHVGGNVKGHTAKAPIMGSPKPHEVP